MLPWILVTLLALALGIALFKQLATAVSVDHISQQLENVEAQRDTLKFIVESHAKSFTREGISNALAGHPELVSFAKGKDTLVVNQVGLTFEDSHLKNVELE